MRILAIDTSSRAVSAALLQDGRMASKYWMEHGKTHSEALFPCIDAVLSGVGVPVEQIDVFTAITGPGSFTGLRIGVSAVKALAYANRAKTVGVSTLDALAYKLGKYHGTLLIPLIDARNDQVYTAIYTMAENCGQQTASEAGIINGVSENRAVFRISEEMAGSIQEAAQCIRQVLERLRGEKEIFDKSIVLILNGDAAQKHLEFLRASLPQVKCICAAEEDLLQDAEAAARLAYIETENGRLLEPEMLMPNYLRLSQAEQMKKGKPGETNL